VANDLTTTHGGAVSSDPQALARLQGVVDNFFTSIRREGGRDTLPNLPVPAVRAQMAERQAALRAVLRPISQATAEQERACKAVAALLGGYLNVKVANPMATAAGYTATLGDQPLFAILRAIDDFKNHRVVDHVDKEGNEILFTMDHAPSAYRLLDQVKKCAAEAQTEHYKIGKVLAVTAVRTRPVMTPDEERYVAEGLARLASGMLKRATRDAEAERQKTRAEAAEARDRAQRIIQDAAARRRESPDMTVPHDEFHVG
jgi:hypothetical protein